MKLLVLAPFVVLLRLSSLLPTAWAQTNATDATPDDNADDDDGGQITIVLGGNNPVASISALNQALATAQSSAVQLQQQVNQLQQTVRQLQAAEAQASTSADLARDRASSSAEAARASFSALFRVSRHHEGPVVCLEHRADQSRRPRQTRVSSRRSAASCP